MQAQPVSQKIGNNNEISDDDKVTGVLNNRKTEQAGLWDTLKVPSYLANMNGRLHYFFEGEALTKLVRDLDVDPKSGKTQQDILREYAKKITERILPFIECPETTGALFNLDYPSNIYEFERQLNDLCGEIVDLEMGQDSKLNSLRLDLEDRVSELNELFSKFPDSDEYKRKYEEYDKLLAEYEEKKEHLEIAYGTYEYLVRRLRKDILKLVREELDSKVGNKELAMMGKFYGRGGIGEVNSCRIGDKDIAMKHRYTTTSVSELGKPVRYPGLGYDSHDLIKVTKESEYLVGFFGSLVTRDKKGESRQIDFFEEITGAVDLRQHLKAVISSDPERLKPSLTVFLESIYLPVLNGVKALHDKKLVHCDIKPENILVQPSGGLKSQTLGNYNQVKLCDYDLVRYSGDQTEMPSGTPTHMSPEQWIGGEITCKSDIYSLGMMLFRLLGAKLPNDMDELQLLAIEGIDVSELNASEDIKNIIEKCLKTNSPDRPNIDELISMIDEYIKKQKEEDRLIQAAIEKKNEEDMIVQIPDEADTKSDPDNTIKMAA